MISTCKHYIMCRYVQRTLLRTHRVMIRAPFATQPILFQVCNSDNNYYDIVLQTHKLYNYYLECISLIVYVHSRYFLYMHCIINSKINKRNFINLIYRLRSPVYT